MEVERPKCAATKENITTVIAKQQESSQQTEKPSVSIKVRKIDVHCSKSSLA